MTDDLLTRLRDHVAAMMPYYRQRKAGKLLIEAADEIERLRAIIAQDQKELAEALRREAKNEDPRF